jgi:hypothetical protein
VKGSEKQEPGKIGKAEHGGEVGRIVEDRPEDQPSVPTQAKHPKPSEAEKMADQPLPERAVGHSEQAPVPEAAPLLTEQPAPVPDPIPLPVEEPEEPVVEEQPEKPEKPEKPKGQTRAQREAERIAKGGPVLGVLTGQVPVDSMDEPVGEFIDVDPWEGNTPTAGGSDDTDAGSA